MIKSIIKETCIMLLLCVAIVLVLGVIFYDYIPANKAIPNKLATYSTPENVREEIEQEVEGSEFNKQENLTYDITGADLDLFEKTNSFISGKPDPFAASTIVEENTTNEIGSTSGGSSSGSSGGSSSGSSSSSGSKNTADKNSTDTYFENPEGLK